MSFNFGASWSTQGSGPQTYVDVAASSDFYHLVALNGVFGQISTSSDQGSTWTKTGSPNQYMAVASSSSGKKIVACSAGYMYTSSDYGYTWVITGPFKWYWDIASSSDASRLVAVTQPWGGSRDYIYVSSDAGVTWIPRGTAQYWQAVASSSDGTRLVAVSSISGPLDDIPSWQLDLWKHNGYTPGHIFISVDSGVTWTQTASLQMWQAVALSSDGTKMVAVVGAGQAAVTGGYAYTTSDGPTP